MGNILRRGVKNFNVENRAHRILDRKTKPAPKHPTTTSQKSLPAIENFQKKDNNLLTMLQSVNVDSSGNDPEFEKSKEGSRLMPTDRVRQPEQTELWNNNVAPEGRLTVPQALQLLAKHQRNRNEWPVERLAQEYKVNPLDTQNIVEYFQSFKVVPIGPKEGDKKPLPPGLTRSKLIT